MAKINRTFFPLLLILSVGITACGDTVTSNDTYGELFTFSLSLLPDGVTIGGAMDATSAFWEGTGPRGYSSDDANSVIAQFVNRDNYSTDAGTVTFSESRLSTLWDHSFYIGAIRPVVEFDGRPYEFSATGEGEFPAFSESISSPVEETRIAFPTWRDTLSRADGVPITWNPGIADTVYIKLTGKGLRSDHHQLLIFSPNTGSYTITSDALSEFKPGNLRLEVQRHNYKPVELSDGRWLLLTIHSDHGLNLHIQ